MTRDYNNGKKMKQSFNMCIYGVYVCVYEAYVYAVYVCVYDTHAYYVYMMYISGMYMMCMYTCILRRFYTSKSLCSFFTGF